MARTTNTYIASADTYVSSASPTSNYSSDSILKTGSKTTPKFASFMGFSVGDIPKNKVIVGMRLQMYYVDLYDEYDNDFSDFSSLPIVVNARRVNGYSIAELYSMSYNSVIAKSGSNNVYGMQHDPTDGSINIEGKESSTIVIPIYDYAPITNSEIVVSLFRNEDYVNENSKMVPHYASIGYYGLTQLYPTLYVDIDDYIPPKPINLSPSNTVRNRQGEIKLSWEFTDSYMGTTQKTFELQYSTNNFSTYTTITGTTNSYATITANTFTNGQLLLWKVRVVDTNNDTSSWSDVANIVIGATTPSMPDVASPHNTIVNSSDEVYFRWKFVDQYGYLQTKFDLEYKQGLTSIPITLTTPDNQYIMPANTLTGGDYSWRVRTYNAFNEVSPYSDWHPFYSIGKPATPIIKTVSNNMHPVITWASTEQDLFVLKIYSGLDIVFDSGEVPGGATEYTVAGFLGNGSYRAVLKTRNLYGFWSNETSYNFAISTTEPTKPSIAGNINAGMISLIVTSGTGINLIYRKGSKDSDYQLITTLSGSAFNDYNARSGENKYFVRTIDDDGFKDSDILTLNLSFKGIILSNTSNPSDNINLYRTKDADKRKAISQSKEQYDRWYVGRTYPVTQSLENRNHVEGHEYFIDYSEFDKLYGIFNEPTVYYKNSYGYSYLARVANIGYQENEFGYVVSFTLTRLEE